MSTIKKLLDNKVFQIIYTIIKVVFFAFLAIYILFVMFQRITNNSDIFGYRMFTVATGSMEPVYKVNDVILVKTVDTSTLKVGDDIAYVGNRAELKGIVITHRIIEIWTADDGEIRYTTQGVNNKNPDPSVSKEQIYGKVMGKVYVVNEINHIVKNIYGFFFLIFCPLVLAIFLEIADTIIDIKLENNELRLAETESKDSKDETKGDDNEGEEEII